MRSAVLAAFVSTVALAVPPPVPSVEISGAVAKPGRINLEGLEAMSPKKASWTSHGKKHEVYGVPLDQVLVKAGFEAGPMTVETPKPQKRQGYKKVLVASARDGFRAVFSLAELMPEMGPTRAMLVWKVDGKPLPDKEAHFRIVVLTDAEPSRSIYAVDRIEVMDLSGAGDAGR